MAIHTHLPIYKAAYMLFDVVMGAVKNMPRDTKGNMGKRMMDESVEITILVFRANVASDKSPHLDELLERVQVIELILRLGMDKRMISRDVYANAVEQTTSIGKQATGWKKSAANRPLHGGQGSHG